MSVAAATGGVGCHGNASDVVVVVVLLFCCQAVFGCCSWFPCFLVLVFVFVVFSWLTRTQAMLVGGVSVNQVALRQLNACCLLLLTHSGRHYLMVPVK